MWADTDKEKMRAKKRCYHTFLADKSSPTNWQLCRIANSGTNKAVGEAAEVSHFGKLCERLDMRGGERGLYNLARIQYCQTQDIIILKVNDDEGSLATGKKKAAERCKRQFESIYGEEFPRPSALHAEH
ncbi:hypothetical protein Y032_0207g2041 [Ancylostoma ceylanicum]|uniref:Uncharacterized protein n=1 Tax=Ancylostoma ceylanicum TaxID=53326 RepID=A0A016SLU6_9BILA|nr:hypothetical protein Y032_0207g2041 [Ancylostoma ceylanicum]